MGQKKTYLSNNRIYILVLCLGLSSFIMAGILNSLPVSASRGGTTTLNQIYTDDVFIQQTLDGGPERHTDAIWGDIDQDGDLDLFVTALLGRSKLYENQQGELILSEWRPYTDHSYSQAADFGDMDGDGDLDLVIANSNTGNVDIFENQNGTFTATVSLTSRITPTSPHFYNFSDVKWVDVNGSGRFDLIVARELSNLNLLGEQLVYYENLESLPNLSFSDPITISPEDKRAKTYAIAPYWDGEHTLYIATANGGGTNEQSDYIYRKDGNEFSCVWMSEPEKSTDIQWGDFNQNGKVDLIVTNGHNIDVKNQIFIDILDAIDALPGCDSPNMSSTIFTFPKQGSTLSVDLGDYDLDGDLDVLFGNSPKRNVVYQNNTVPNSPTLDFSPVYTSPNELNSAEVSWADFDGDGDLDFTSSNGFNYAQSAEIYENNFNSVSETNLLQFSYILRGGDGAIGDLDDDGDLDYLFGSYITMAQTIEFLENQNGILNSTPVTLLDNQLGIRGMDVGDVNGDGLLDIVIANGTAPSLTNKIYTQIFPNGGGLPQFIEADLPGLNTTSTSIALGDFDADGDLDIALGNTQGPNEVLVNENGQFSSSRIYSTTTSQNTAKVSWGDIDNDGDLDLAAAHSNGQADRVYLTENGALIPDAVWQSDLLVGSYDIAWGDVDGDGDLDLAVAHAFAPNAVYFNENGVLSSSPSWFSSDIFETTTIKWVDFDGDGDLDLSAADNNPSLNRVSKIYVNEKGQLNSAPILLNDLENSNWLHLWGDPDKDGDYDLLEGNNGNTAPANFKYFENLRHDLRRESIGIYIGQPAGELVGDLATTQLFSDTELSLQYNLHGSQGTLFDVVGYYSINGNNWQPISPTAGTQTRQLLSSPISFTKSVTHTYTFNLFENGVFGQTDNFKVRMIAKPVVDLSLGTATYVNQLPGPFRQAAAAAETFPFKVRGTLIKVVDRTDSAVQDAIVYRQESGDEVAELFTNESTGTIYNTDQLGFVRGFGDLNTGDSLVALFPLTLSNTDHYSVYHTSAEPIPSGLNAHVVDTEGVQLLTVSEDHTLLLFNLAVSLEWDGRQDTVFLEQLDQALQRTSEILYDATDGQAALGEIRVYHDKGFWDDADIVIRASNQTRPAAVLGGSVAVPTTEMVTPNPAIANDLGNALNGDGELLVSYVPGQIQMPARWSPFGTAQGTLGEDWARTLAHELGHYYFFLPDNYLGVDDELNFALTTCAGSLMDDPYLDQNSEFLFDGTAWGDCSDTMANQYLNRSDWETILVHYPMLKAPTGEENQGPNYLPLNVTDIHYYEPVTPTQTLENHFFPLVDDQSDPYFSAGLLEGYLWKNIDTGDDTDDYVIDLGTTIPAGNYIEAWGAEPGDRICLFDRDGETAYFGCLDIGSFVEPIEVNEVSNWTPDIEIQPISTTTVGITISNVTADELDVQLITPVGQSSKLIRITKNPNGTFTHSLSSTTGAFYGHIYVSVADGSSDNEAIFPFQNIFGWEGKGAVWGGKGAVWGGKGAVWGGKGAVWGGKGAVWGGKGAVWGAPTVSNDAQVSIFPLKNIFDEEIEFTLSRLSYPPTLPTYLTQVGQPYLVESISDNLPEEAAIVFSYLSDQVPDGFEGELSIYYLQEGQPWERLRTDVDTRRNIATAKVVGEGMYALVATPEMPSLVPGQWNDLIYPFRQSQTITETLASIDGKYTAVYHFNGTTWELFVPSAQGPFAPHLQTLTEAEFGNNYLISVTETVTPYLGIPAMDSNREPALDEGFGSVNGVSESSDLYAGRMSFEADALSRGATPPAIFYGHIGSINKSEPMIGDRVEAHIDGRVCGETTIFPLDSHMSYVIQVEAESIDQHGVCGRSQATVELLINQVSELDDLAWQSGQHRQIDINPDGIILPLPNQIFLPLIFR